MMKVYNACFIALCMVITLCNFLSSSIAQEVKAETLRNDLLYTLELDYELEEERHSSVVYSYSPAASSSAGNSDPQLANGKVAPGKGAPSTLFYYSVDYSDSNSDAPATISVFVDDAPSSMSLSSGVASNGTYTSPAHSLDPGAHTYYFSTTDGNGGSARLPSSGSTSGPEVNNSPALSEGKVDPTSGTSSTKIYYEVIYYDPGGEAPSEIYVYVDGTPFYMILESGVADEGTYTSAAHLLDSGNHTYYFTATDSNGDSVRMPPSGSLSGPEVNNPPQLSGGNVNPAAGKSSSDFYYSVNCYDEEGDSPGTASVYIDSVAYTMTLLIGEKDNGTYQYGPQLLAEGSHEYYFSFTDELSNQSRLPVSGSFTGPVINDPPQLSGGKVDPDSGNGATNFYFYVEYYDNEKDVPKTTYVYIDDVAYVMDSYSGEAFDGTYRYGPKMLKPGNHEYYFSFADSYNGTARLPEEESYNGPDIVAGSLYVYDNIGGADIILADSSTGYTTPSILSPVSAGIHKVELAKDEYVSFPSYAVVEVIQDQTTEIPFILLPCPAVIALKGESDHLNLLRNFRDTRLYQTEGGKEYINLYYLCAAEISLMIINDSEVNAKLRDILQQFIPPLTFLMQEEKVTLPFGIQEELRLLLDVLEIKGSPFLKAALKKVRKDLREGAIFKKLGVEIDGGSLQLD